eukprot:CFRG8185T1
MSKEVVADAIPVSPQEIAKDFVFESVLKEVPDIKSCFLRGSMKGQPAVLIMSKPPFECEKLKEVVASLSQVTVGLCNDIYTNMSALLAPEYSRLSLTLICPATDAHFCKYSMQEMTVISETPHLYETATKPFIEAQPISRISWVYNILEGTKEADRVILRDDDPSAGFVMVMDMKWDGIQPENCYCVAIVMDRSIRSLRDLTVDSLPMLNNILEKGRSCLEETYGIPVSKQRVYVHYQPTYYHFHVHFTHVSYMAPGTHVGKAHLLTDIIANIESFNEFYTKASLSYILGVGQPLHTALSPHL